MIHVIHQTESWAVNMGMTEGEMIITNRVSGQAGVFTPESFDDLTTVKK